VIIKSYEIIKKKFKDLNFFLLYGENEGLKKDCIKEICTIKNIKTLTTKYDEIEIINNPENFHNLIFSGSLFERDKIIIINQASDRLTDTIQNSINKKIQNITIFLLAYKLDKRSKIRNLFEKNESLVCIPTYQENEIQLKKIINNEMQKFNFKLSQESINLIINRSKGDRENIKTELEKIKIFSKNKESISLEDVRVLTNMSENFENEEIINLCLSGNKKKLLRTLEENNFSNEDFFILLKILNKKIHRLIKIKNLIKIEKNLEKSLNQLKPPIFWKEKEIVKKQLTLWNIKGLEKVLYKLNQLELTCKKNQELSVNIILDFLANNFFTANNYS